MAEKELNPTWAPKNLKLNQSLEFSLDSAKAIVTGTSKYGQWNMWSGYTDNPTIVKNPDKTENLNYTGKFVFFASEKLQEKLLAITNGVNRNIKVKVTKVAKENAKGLPYTSYEVESLGPGNAPDYVPKSQKENNPFESTTSESNPFGNTETSMSEVEEGLVTQARNAKKEGKSISEDIFTQVVGSKGISAERAKELYKLV